MQCCPQVNLKLNFDKAFVKQPQIKFCCLICGQDGVKPDPDKVIALQNRQPPTDIKELQSFLGLTNYMSPFIKNASSLTAPLHELVTSKSEFAWSESHQQAFDTVKSAISDVITQETCCAASRCINPWS